MTKYNTAYGVLDVDIDMADGFDCLCISVGRSFGKSRKQKLAVIERNKRLMKAGKIEFDEYEEVK